MWRFLLQSIYLLQKVKGLQTCKYWPNLKHRLNESPHLSVSYRSTIFSASSLYLYIASSLCLYISSPLYIYLKEAHNLVLHFFIFILLHILCSYRSTNLSSSSLYIFILLHLVSVFTEAKCLVLHIVIVITISTFLRFIFKSVPRSKYSLYSAINLIG